MAEADAPRLDGAAMLAEMAHWQAILGQAEMLLMEHGASALLKMGDDAQALFADQLRAGRTPGPTDDLWHGALDFWRDFLGDGDAPVAAAARRVTAMAGVLRRTRSLLAMEIARQVERSAAADGQARAALRTFLAMLAAEDDGPEPSPREIAVAARAIATHGQSLLAGLEQMLHDVASGALHPAPTGAPRGDLVLETPVLELFVRPGASSSVPALLILPPRDQPFTLLDLPAPDSFLEWAGEQGFATATVRWKTSKGIGADGDLASVRGLVDHLADAGEVPLHLLAHGEAATLILPLLQDEALVRRGIASAALLCPPLRAALCRSGEDDVPEAIPPAWPLLGEAIRGYVIGLFLDPADHTARARLRWAMRAAAGPPVRTALLRDRVVDPRVDVPCYLLAGDDDRIAPPASVWLTARNASAPVRLVLGEGDHAAAIVPSTRAGYRTRDNGTPPVPSDPRQEGRWWDDWLAWTRARQPA